MKRFCKVVSVGLVSCALSLSALSSSADRSVKVLGWGAQSGPLKSFGVNSETALRSAVAEINAAGGVKLGDGSMAPIEVIGTIANSCSHPIDVQIIAQAFGTHGNILAAEKEFMYEIYGKYMVPHPIPILHVVPGQPVVVGFHLNFYDVDNDEVKAVDIAVAEVDSAP